MKLTTLPHASLCLLPLLCQPAMAAVSEKEVSDTSQQLPTVEVKGDAATTKGRTAQGYRVSEVNLGPLGNKKVLDQPYSVHSLSSDLIQDQQVDGTPELLKYLPSTQVEYRGGGEIGRPQSRGFQADLLQNTRIDGYSVGAHFPQPVELYERQDVLYGLAGSLYGPSNAAGIFNSILKRPTDTTRLKAGVSYEDATQLTSRIDAGGRMGADDKFGYRLNLMHGDGERYVENSNLRRELAGLALDARLTEQTLLELNTSRYIYDQTGYPGSFAIGATLARMPEAPDPTTVGYGQPFANSKVTSDLYGVRLTQHLNPAWKLTMGVQQQDVLRELRSASNTLSYQPASDSFNLTTNSSTPEGYTKQKIVSNQIYLNGLFKTGELAHELVLGSNGYQNPSYQAATASNKKVISSCTGTLDAPCLIAQEPSWSGYGAFSKTGKSQYQDLLLGDTLLFNEQWSMQAVLSNSWIKSENYADPGKDYRFDHALSYSTALIYKPRSTMSTYLSYANSVQPGGTAPTGTSNANETLKPYDTTQYEAGYKAELSHIDFSAAVFRIKRPLAYTGLDNVYREQGNQLNKGLELMAKGKVSDNTTLFGGVTYIDAKLNDTKLATTDDKQVIGVPEWQANMLASYDLPQVPGLSLTGNLHYTGKRAANNTNTLWADGYTTLDLGTRIKTKAYGKPLTWRLGVNNVTDEHYWASLMPGGTDGDTVAGASAYMGEPRTFKTTLQLEF